MKPTEHEPLNTPIYAAAADWLVEFRSGDVDAAGRRAFYAWLRTSPEHMRAYLELAAIWNEGGGLDTQREYDDEALMAAIREQTNVVTVPASQFGRVSKLDASSRASPLAQALTRSPLILRALAASLLLIASGMGFWAYSHHGVYSTDIGEQRTLTLSDGSRIELNARSKVRIRYTSSARAIELVDGQAFFRVAKDKTRPLIVSSGSTRVRAVGTQFDVYRKTEGVVVTVVEGRVSVDRPPGTRALSSDSSAQRDTVVALALVAGEQAIATSHTTVKQLQPNISAATAWTQGRLVFQGATLQDVADEFNRYNARRLVIHDPDLADFKVTGIFASTDPASLIRFLEVRPGIVVVQNDDEIRVSHKE